MTLENALQASAVAGKAHGFTPVAYIKEEKKLPILAFSKTQLEYHLASEVGDVGYNCNYLLAKWMLRHRIDWQPKLTKNDSFV